jgi:hypothetical protein
MLGRLFAIGHLCVPLFSRLLKFWGCRETWRSFANARIKIPEGRNIISIHLTTSSVARSIEMLIDPESLKILS